MRIWPIILVLAYDLAFAAEEPKIIATSDWSKPVGGGTDWMANIRGRLVILQGREVGDASVLLSTMVYVELQNMSGKPTELYFDGAHGHDFRTEYKGGLNCELFDSQGKAVSESGSGGGFQVPRSEWISLPLDSTIRLRANPFGFRSTKEGGLRLPFLGHDWFIKPQDTNHYFLVASFTSISPTNHVSEELKQGRSVVLDGTLLFPKIVIASQGR